MTRAYVYEPSLNRPRYTPPTFSPTSPSLSASTTTSPHLTTSWPAHLRYPPVTDNGRHSVALTSVAASWAGASSYLRMAGDTQGTVEIHISVGMEASHSSSMLPLHRCKIIHLVRHAQGIHNVEGEKDHNAYLTEELFDAYLTPRGWKQVDNLRKHVIACGLSKKIDLVITSPLLRTMQTAAGVFGGQSLVDGVKGPPLMVENVGNSDHLAISSLDCPPFIAVEACRENMGVHPCDRRRTISDYKKLFPAVDFSLIENDEDILWKPDVREANDEVAVRGMKFINWLWTRKEREIAVVTHSAFLFHTLSQFGKDSHPLIKDYISKHFANCELRSIVLVDSSLFGSDTASTNYPGSIPQGVD